MIDSDREVFKRIGEETEIDFLTYAIYSFEKHQWMAHYCEQSGDYPNEVEIARWISEITDFRFASYREEAARFFDVAAREYMAVEIERAQQQAVRESILSEVKAAGSWWRQTAIALVTAILAPLIIGAVIVSALWYDQFMFQATDVLHRFQPPLGSRAP